MIKFPDPLKSHIFLNEDPITKSVHIRQSEGGSNIAIIKPDAEFEERP